jgi:ubiquinone/menaquinone biosynthesis C-methylase UbiE
VRAGALSGILPSDMPPNAHPLFARLYARMAPASERAGAAGHRDELLADLRGRVIEVGAGSGLCFAHYPTSVTEVLAVEPEPYLRRLSEQAAGEVPVAVRVLAGGAEHLPVEDGSVDAVVFSLVLCSVPEPGLALKEAHRVLVPGGALAFYEHVRSERPGEARFQDVADRVWPHLTGGCHPNRETARSIADAGFRIERCRHFSFRPRLTSAPAGPHILGRAVRV